MGRYKQDAFVENSIVEEQSPRPQRLSLRLTPEGALDAESTSATNLEKLRHLLRSDDPTVQQFLGQDKAAETALEIKEEHVRQFLDAYAWVEQLVMPAVIASRTKGAVRIPAQIAAAAYQFSPETKDRLAPSGVEWANSAFPEWLKAWLAKAGPGAVFFCGLFIASVAQTKAAMAMYMASVAPSEPAKTNGQAKPAVVAEEVIQP